VRLHLPHDAAAERAVLGSALLDPECWVAAAEVLRSSDFYDPKHATTWRAMEALSKTGVTLDKLLVRSQLLTSGMLEQAGGDEYLAELGEHIPTTENTVRLGKRVQQLSIVRRVQMAAMRLADEGSQPIADLDDYIDRASTVLASLCHQRGSDLDVIPLADALDEAYARLVQRQSVGQSLLGHSTGLIDLDHAIGGLTPGDLIVLAARPAMGKTALCNTLKLGVARSTQHPVLSLELEMTREQLSHRVLSTESGVDMRRIRAAALSGHDMGDLARTADELGRLPVFFIDRRGTKISALRKAARRLVASRGPLSLITVDYLQIAKAERREERREREVSDISAQLKTLAGEMNCPVLALSQLNRGVESRSDKRPMLSDLRESGSIEQDADTVMFLYRDEEYHPKTTQEPGIAEVIVAKQRSGPTGTIKLRWVKELTRFQDVTASDLRGTQAEMAYGQGHSAGSSNGARNGHSGNGHSQAGRDGA